MRSTNLILTLTLILMTGCHTEIDRTQLEIEGDVDDDGVPDAIDNCPSFANELQIDEDADGAGNGCDDCPGVPEVSVAHEVCGCNPPNVDNDGDGFLDGYDDRDGDGTVDCAETCDSEPLLQRPVSICGCDPMAAQDDDGDGLRNCNDRCPQDPYKSWPGECGCGHPDVDTDGDGFPNCNPCGA